ncbi:MAG: alpha/beta hydrolase [Eggerthellaceae bacterium]|jgi:acetyl esterase/lipase
MGMIYELLSTPPAYLKKALVRSENAGRSREPIIIPFGSHRLQHCVLWEPDEVTHEMPVMYFHGGGYLVGTPESMIDAANVYNSMGYRFCSVGFRLMPSGPFPAQVDDAFAGISAARAWMGAHGRPAERFFVGGSSCGGHLAMLVGYGSELQRAHGLDARAVAGVISVAGITHVDDMLLRPFPAGVWGRFVALPAAGGEDGGSGAPAAGGGRDGRSAPAINGDGDVCHTSAAGGDCDGRRATTASGSRGERHRPTAGKRHDESYVLAASRSRGDRHRALLPYSPVELIEQIPTGQWVPPFFAIHGYADKMSPYVHEAAFAEKLRRLYGPDTARLFTVDRWTWQHMWTTVTLHKDRVEESVSLRELFAWLAAIGGGASVEGEA